MLEPEDLPSDGYWHVAIRVKGGYGWITQYDMSKEILLTSVVYPYRTYDDIFVSGHRICRENIKLNKISHTNIQADSFPYLKNGSLNLYRNLFDKAPNSEDYLLLLNRNGLEAPYISDAEYKEKMLKASAEVNVIQNQKQAQNQTTSVVVNNNYQQLSELIEKYADLITELRKKDVPLALFAEAIEVQDQLDSISKVSDDSKVLSVLRKVKRITRQLGETAKNVTPVITLLNALLPLFGA